MTEVHPIKDASFYKSLLDSVPFTVAVIDKNGEILYTNWQWERFGLENEIDPAYLGTGNNYFGVCRTSDDETAEEALEGIRSVVQGDQEEYTQEYPCHSEDEKRWFIMRVRPFTVDSSTFYFIAHSDITERVKTEKKLRHAEKLASLGEMAAGLMHEINNPNASIKLNTEYLEKGWEKISESLEDVSISSSDESMLEEFSGSIEAIQKGSQRIEDIVNKVNVFAGRTDESTSDQFDTGEAIREVLQPYQDRLDGDVISVEFRGMDEQELTLPVDRSGFQQLVTNLVDNAVDATEECEDPEILVRTSRTDGALRVQIADNGPGIPEKETRKIFDPFFTTKEPGEGTGLGLSIVRGIIDRFDGDIEIDAENGEGTTFTIEIPVLEDD